MDTMSPVSRPTLMGISTIGCVGGGGGGCSTLLRMVVSKRWKSDQNSTVQESQVVQELCAAIGVRRLYKDIYGYLPTSQLKLPV